MPVLTYRAQVWYTGKQQKGLLNRLTVAQNDGLRKITGVFRTTPVEPLTNLTGIPPIPFYMNKLMHVYSHRLRRLDPQVKVRQILTEDRCRYWPTYFNPITNLSRASANLGPSTYRPRDPCTAGPWSHPRVTYTPSPPESVTKQYRGTLARPVPSDLHLFLLHHVRNAAHFGLAVLR